MKKTIYNVYVVMDSQEQCDRMKQLCVDNGLPIWKTRNAFDFDMKYRRNIFHCGKDNKKFSVAWYRLPCYPEDLTQVTEQEFIELLKTTK